MNMKRGLFIAAALLAASSVQATPILQTYIEGATAGDLATDQDTWFFDASAGDTVTLYTIGNYQTSNILGINNGTLVFTVPDGQDPTIRMASTSSGFTTLPLAGTFDDAATFETFLGASFANHAPYGLAADQVDIYAFAIDSVFPGQGTFDPFVPAVPDCNADVAGTTSCASGSPGQEGEFFSYLMQVTDVDWIHIDLIAEVTRQVGGNIVTDWEINPFSHDSTLRLTGGGGTGTTSVPLPGTLPLLGLPLLLWGLRRR